MALTCCPLMSYRNKYGSETFCLTEKCELWDEKKGCCLIKSIMLKFLDYEKEDKINELKE